MNKQLSVLVTGASGFIGNYVIEELIRKNIHVIATSMHQEKAMKFNWYRNVTYIPLDLSKLNNNKDYFSYFKKPDSLIHLAWEGLPNYKSDFHVTDNLPRHKLFLGNLIENGLKDINIIGSCLEYGIIEGCLNESMKISPVTNYGIAKNLLKQYLDDLLNKYTFDLKWIRLFYMFGKGQNTNSLLSQLDRAIQNNEPVFNMSKGDQLRDYLPVEKVSEYIVKISLQKTITGIINCCSGYPVSVNKFVETYLNKRNVSMKLNLGYYPYNDYEAKDFWGDNHKLKTIISQE